MLPGPQRRRAQAWVGAADTRQGAAPHPPPPAPSQEAERPEDRPSRRIQETGPRPPRARKPRTHLCERSRKGKSAQTDRQRTSCAWVEGGAGVGGTAGGCGVYLWGRGRGWGTSVLDAGSLGWWTWRGLGEAAEQEGRGHDRHPGRDGARPAADTDNHPVGHSALCPPRALPRSATGWTQKAPAAGFRLLHAREGGGTARASAWPGRRGSRDGTRGWDGGLGDDTAAAATPPSALTEQQPEE